MNTESAIEVFDLKCSLGGQHILCGINFKVCWGEYLSIVGANGAGKTTLLRCLIRAAKRASGRIMVAGNPIEKLSQKDLAKLVSYVPQAGGYVAPFSVYEFVMMGRYPHLSAFSSPTATDKDVVEWALESSGTKKFSHRSLMTLSGGERQQVFIAAALSQEAKILLLDEPTTFLDPRHESEVQTLLMKVNKEYGVTIVSVTHNINSAAMCSDRILALKDGASVFIGHTEDFMNELVLTNIFDKKFTMTLHPQSRQALIMPDVVR